LNGLLLIDDNKDSDTTNNHNDKPKDDKPKEPTKVGQNHIAALMAMVTKKGDTDEGFKEKIKKAYGLDSKKDLTIEQFNRIMKAYEKMEDKV
jgi:hypothetical protein